MYCTKCGAVLPPGAAFCGACGHSVVFPPASAQGTIPPSAPPVGGLPYGYAQSPYQLAAVPQVPYADFGLRLLAYIIDAALIGTVVGACALTIFILLGGFAYFQQLGQHDGPGPVFPALLLMSVAGIFFGAVTASWLYYALMESSSRQGTLGKVFLGLIVTDLQGSPVTFGRASGRFFARFITRLIPFWIGYIMAAFTDKRQALHDMIASCLVLKKV